MTLYYKRPILDWQGIPSRFFKFIYDTMTPQYSVSTSQLSLPNATILGDAAVKYNIFGGGSTITIKPERLEFEFPVIMEADRELISDILQRVHDTLLSSFPECEYEALDLRDIFHADFVNMETETQADPNLRVSVTDYLDRFKIPDLESAFEGLGEFEQFSSGRVEAKALDRSWSCRIMTERSLLSPNGVFIDSSIRLEGDRIPIVFSDKQDLISRLRTATLKSIGLCI